MGWLVGNATVGRKRESGVPSFPLSWDFFRWPHENYIPNFKDHGLMIYLVFIIGKMLYLYPALNIMQMFHLSAFSYNNSTILLQSQ
jgi:hypothetical protein